MRKLWGIPIVRTITSIRNLSPGERRRLKRLKEIFRRENRIPSETSFQEMRYLLRLEAGRKRYRRNRRPTISNQREWREAMKSAYPSWDQPIEEILGLLAKKREEQNKRPEK